MTKQDWATATDEEREAEFNRCKDPVYLYNNYWLKPNGTKPEPITREQYVDMVAHSQASCIKWRKNSAPKAYIERLKEQIRKELNY